MMGMTIKTIQAKLFCAMLFAMLFAMMFAAAASFGGASAFALTAADICKPANPTDPPLTRAECIELLEKALFDSLLDGDGDGIGGEGKSGGGVGADAGGNDGGDGGDNGDDNNGQNNAGDNAEQGGNTESVAVGDIEGDLPDESAEQAAQSQNAKQNAQQNARAVKKHASTRREDKKSQPADNRTAGRENEFDEANVPSDIPPSENDDIIARQFRQAALDETDPVARAKLWNEYRRYKNLPLQEVPDQSDSPSNSSGESNTESQP